MCLKEGSAFQMRCVKVSSLQMRGASKSFIERHSKWKTVEEKETRLAFVHPHQNSAERKVLE